MVFVISPEAYFSPIYITLGYIIVLAIAFFIVISLFLSKKPIDYELELERLDRKLKNNLISEEEYNKFKKKLDIKYKRYL